MYWASRPLLFMSISDLLFLESYYSCTALLFFLMPRCIHAFYSHMFSIYSYIASDHTLHLLMCFICDSQVPDLSHRYMHSFIHFVPPLSNALVIWHCALALSLFFPSCINYMVLYIRMCCVENMCYQKIYSWYSYICVNTEYILYILYFCLIVIHTKINQLSTNTCLIRSIHSTLWQILYIPQLRSQQW